MKLPSLWLAVLVAFCTVAGSALAQEADEEKDPDYQKPKLISVPRVQVPAEARQTGLGGVIGVLVSVDDKGSVKSAEQAVGPDWTCPDITRADVVALKTAALEAARQASFEPATKKLKPVKSSMWLRFTFPKKAENGSPGPGSQQGAFVADPNKPASINGGVINGRAKVLAKPGYPPEARAAGLSGTVSVQVVIDEDGTVFSAEPVSGHSILGRVSRFAACESKFSPTSIKGAPVKVVGIITYNFVP